MAKKHNDYLPFLSMLYTKRFWCFYHWKNTESWTTVSRWTFPKKDLTRYTRGRQGLFVSLFLSLCEVK